MAARWAGWLVVELVSGWAIWRVCRAWHTRIWCSCRGRVGPGPIELASCLVSPARRSGGWPSSIGRALPSRRPATQVLVRYRSPVVQSGPPDFVWHARFPMLVCAVQRSSCRPGSLSAQARRQVYLQCASARAAFTWAAVLRFAADGRTGAFRFAWLPLRTHGTCRLPNWVSGCLLVYRSSASYWSHGSLRSRSQAVGRRLPEWCFPLPFPSARPFGLPACSTDIPFGWRLVRRHA